MDKAFNFKIKEEFFDNDEYKNIGEQIVLKSKEKSLDVLKKYIDTESKILDGQAIQKEWFYTAQSDVFISYSHNDEKLVETLVGWLQQEFKLKVFLDEAVWGCADKLLKEIDNKHCFCEDKKRYDYKKRNFSTSHVHAMLTTAIMKAIESSKCVIFINTNHSLPIAKDVITNYTLSPWLYEELVFTDLMLKQIEKEKVITEGAFEAKNLQIAHSVPMERLITLNEKILKEWLEIYLKRKENPLELLYKMTKRDIHIWLNKLANLQKIIHLTSHFFKTTIEEVAICIMSYCYI